jgi:hypothetical protein
MYDVINWSDRQLYWTCYYKRAKKVCLIKALFNSRSDQIDWKNVNQSNRSYNWAQFLIDRIGYITRNRYDWLRVFISFLLHYNMNSKQQIYNVLWLQKCKKTKNALEKKRKNKQRKKKKKKIKKKRKK